MTTSHYDRTLPGIGRAAFLLLACSAFSGQVPASQSLPPLGAGDRARLGEVVRLATTMPARIWPGWERTPLAILLVSDSAEYLLGHPRPGADFTHADGDSVRGMAVWARPRVFAPTLLATFPAVGGLPTIVVGTPERTRKSSVEWVLTLLHEHFHQWQYSLPGYYRRVALLDLAGGDSTGMWMLNYPFPYGQAPVRQAARDMADALGRALDAPPEGRPSALGDVAEAHRRLAARLTPAEFRYLEFQLWQEGVARFIEYRAADLAKELGTPAAEFLALPDYEPYAGVAARGRRSLGSELAALDLGRDRRVSFYPLGAALALLLEDTRADWKLDYQAHPFTVTQLLEQR